MKHRILTLLLATTLPATFASAQNEPKPRDGGPKNAPRDGERRKGEGPREGERRERPMPFLHALDADMDGVISASEMQGAPAALKKLDQDGDGKLTREEWHAPPPAEGQRRNGEQEGAGKAAPRDGEKPRTGPRDGERPPGGPRDGEGEKRNGKPDENAKKEGERPPAPPLVGALDADRDGVISAEEIDKSAEALAKLDENKDGQLGPREYGGRPPRDREKGAEKPAQ